MKDFIDIFGKEDERPPLLKCGWAPGSYGQKCKKCGDMFLGDKRAWSCADCAYKNVESECKPPMRNRTPEELLAEIRGKALYDCEGECSCPGCDAKNSLVPIDILIGCEAERLGIPLEVEKVSYRLSKVPS